ncbi:MAG: undecaprenyl-phosphate galactose phosphotransferase [uncultured bacterium]|uniref:Bacterial sugar transferase domain-containing protein n=1 Tax=candidate division WWE3 bacterium RBG_16_37_10 TaxID=1802610 RepID=A0A1F4UT55_UNCKA|nr:MAG: undecaprenyl-phosphate galactose phosphotransferase [uncultured bacterium]OGC48141.1 MAG: hypothetical protein A2W32_01545 [candidate division WWE3 bacterium RBG_16_37_10]
MQRKDGNDFYNFGKRLIDVSGAFVGIIIFSIPMFLTAVWIKLVSPDGPVFADIPERIGRNGKKFKMYKFRSMIPNAAQFLRENPNLYAKYVANNYKLNANEDPRIIKGGEFIRKFSIDELPQFLNILKGDMSMVGPRAYYPFEIDEQKQRFPESIPYINELIKVKPGITGVWQVGGRSKIGFLERVKMDADYASKRSLVYDLLIILKTPYVVLTKKGAL